MFIIAIFSRCIEPFINVECASLSLINVFGVKSILSTIFIATPALLDSVCWNVFPSCHFQPVSLDLK